MSFDSACRLKLTKRPMIKVGSQFKQDHGIFDPDADVETPVRMRKPVEVEVPVESDSLRVGRKHIPEPKHAEPPTKGFSGGSYDPARSDRFQATKRNETSGNLISGEGVGNDAFMSRVGKSVQNPSTAVGENILHHAPGEVAPSVSRRRHANHDKQTRGYCPWAIDDSHVEPEQPFRPLHPSHMDHGDVLTGGPMNSKYAGRHL